jgi:hypothetical protein
MFESTADFRSAFVRPREASLCLNPVRSNLFLGLFGSIFGRFFTSVPSLSGQTQRLLVPSLSWQIGAFRLRKRGGLLRVPAPRLSFIYKNEHFNKTGSGQT